jgi:integrase
MKKLYVKNEDGTFEELQAVVIGNGLTDLKKVPLKKAINQYIKICTSQKSLSNHNKEKLYFRNLISDVNVLFVSDIQMIHIEKHKNKMLKKLKPSSVERRLAVFRHFFQKCVEWEYLLINPMMKIKKMRIEKNHYQTWTHDEFLKVTKSCKYPFDKIIEFLWYSGCRPAEILKIKKTDIDYDNKLITLSCGKNANISRQIPMSNQLDKILHSIKSPGNLVFTFNDKPITTDGLYQHTKHRLIALGLNNLTVYGIRHTFASRMSEQGLNAFQIQYLMGHSDIKTTLNYVHHEKNILIEALNKANK